MGTCFLDYFEGWNVLRRHDQQNNCVVYLTLRQTAEVNAVHVAMCDLIPFRFFFTIFLLKGSKQLCDSVTSKGYESLKRGLGNSPLLIS